MVLHWILSVSKSPQVSKTRLRILAVLSNAVVWIVSTRPPISKSSRPFNNPLVIVPNYYYSIFVFLQLLIMIIYILRIYVFCCFLWDVGIFFRHIDSTLQIRWAVTQNESFCVSCRLGLPDIFLICLFVPFLTIPKALAITDTMVVLRCYIFSISISRTLYLLILSYSLTDMSFSIRTDISIRRHV